MTGDRNHVYAIDSLLYTHGLLSPVNLGCE